MTSSGQSDSNSRPSPPRAVGAVIAAALAELTDREGRLRRIESELRDIRKAKVALERLARSIPAPGDGRAPRTPPSLGAPAHAPGAEQEVLRVLREASGPMTARDVANGIDRTYGGWLSALLARLASRGLVVNVDGENWAAVAPGLEELAAEAAGAES